MRALRLALLVAAAAMLPSCGRNWNQWVHLTVRNQGSVSADVRAEAEYWSGIGWEDHAEFSVRPQETVEAHFRFNDLRRLNARIYRSSDHLKIFDDFWNRGELEDQDERVTIIVTPGGLYECALAQDAPDAPEAGPRAAAAVASRTRRSLRMPPDACLDETGTPPAGLGKQAEGLSQAQDERHRPALVGTFPEGH